MTVVTAYADKAVWFSKHYLKQTWRGLLGVPSEFIKQVKYAWIGFLMVFAAWKDWMVMTRTTEMLKAKRSLATAQGLQIDTREWNERDKKAANHQKVSLIGGGILFVTVLILWLIFRNQMVILPVFPWEVTISKFNLGALLFAFVTFLGLDAIGHSKKDPEEVQDVRPVTPLESGVSIRKLQASIKEILAVSSKPVFITFHGQDWFPHGVELACHTSDKITDDHLEELERHLQAGRGMITLIRDRYNQAAPTLRLFWRDPLEGSVTPERRAPKSLSCKNPFSLTRRDDGSRGSLHVLGTHILITGQSGSGKSSGVWTFLDWLVDCRDADAYGIDVAGTVFASYRRVMAGLADTEDDAVAILDAAIAECERRRELLNAGMDADEDGLADENWVITDAPTERAWYIILDEYKAIAQQYDAIRTRVEHLMEIGRKFRVHIVISSPAADKKSLVTTTPVNQSMTKIIFSIPFSMITHTLGVGFSDDGWRPDRFEVGTPNDPADSGKAYIQSPDNPRPIVQRFDRLTLDDIRERNRDRVAFMKNKKLPPVVEFLRNVFEEKGNPEKLRTADIIEDSGWTGSKLSTALRDLPVSHNLAAKAIWVEGKTERGYELAPLRELIRKLSV
jgi:hypothetical protein